MVNLPAAWEYTPELISKPHGAQGTKPAKSSRRVSHGSETQHARIRIVDERIRETGKRGFRRIRETADRETGKPRIARIEETGKRGHRGFRKRENTAVACSGNRKKRISRKQETGKHTFARGGNIISPPPLPHPHPAPPPTHHTPHPATPSRGFLNHTVS